MATNNSVASNRCCPIKAVCSSAALIQALMSLPRWQSFADCRSETSSIQWIVSVPIDSMLLIFLKAARNDLIGPTAAFCVPVESSIVFVD